MKPTNFRKADHAPFFYNVPVGSKILFANFPADGHFNPLTGLAMHLKSIGYDVRWYTAKAYQERVEKLGIPSYLFRRALEVDAANIEQIFPEREKHKSQVSKLVFDMIHAFILRAPEYYEDIREIYENFPFDVMISDVAFGAIPFVKEHLKVPVISIGVFPLVETSRDLPPSGLGMTPAQSVVGKIKQRLLHYVADRILFAKPTKIMRQLLGRYGIDAGNSNVFDIMVKKSTLVLQSGTPGFEYFRSDLGHNIRFIGPLLPYTAKKKQTQPWYHEKLAQYRKVILVTQGTVEKDPEKIIVPTLEAFKNSDYLVIATTGGSKTEELRQRYPHHNIIIEDFIPFTDVMPYAHVYVTNGGYGGVMLGIEHQLPLVVGGVHEGKNEICARIGYFGLGINLKTERPSALLLKKSIEEVMNNAKYAIHVKMLAKEFARYHPHELCARYVEEVLGTPHRKNIATLDREMIY